MNVAAKRVTAAALAAPPRKHQLLACNAVLNEFKRASRTTVVMACGTGKTFVSLLVAGHGGYKRIVVLVPSLALVRQMLAEYRARASRWNRWDTLAVCSDASVADDEAYVAPDEVGCRVTSDAKDAAQFLGGEGARVVFCTYHSAHLLSGLRFDLGIFDEAHRTAGARGKVFGFALSNDNVRIAKRLFMTATPRHSSVGETGDAHEVFSMDDPKVYGRVCYQLGFRRAISAGLICDYEIVICPLRKRINTRGERAAQVALRKAMEKFRCKRAFTFHRTIERAEGFADDRSRILTGFAVQHVNGTMSTRERDARLESLARWGGVVTNVRCLAEGVDVPAVDLVGFVDPKHSTIDIVQAIGRCLRRSVGKKRGFVFVPVYVPPKRTVEQAVADSKFGAVFDVLQAMKEQDELLMTNLRRAGEALHAGSTVDVRGVTVLDDGGRVKVGALSKAITARLVRTLSGVRATDEKKRQLLALARRGAPRPAFRSVLGNALIKYVNKGESYDAAFDREIRRLAPQWFVNPADEKKRQLLALARSGAPRPHATTVLGSALIRYTHGQYDAKFDREIRRLAPHWFVNSADEKKRQLLALARSGAPRPAAPASLGSALCIYTTRGGTSYDAKFDREIRRLAPHWFVNSADEKKKRLLALARRGAPRPAFRSVLGGALSTYTRRGQTSYDAKFDREIRRLAPQWFVNSADEKKRQLLALARSGAPRPLWSSELGSALGTYTRRGSDTFDAKFDREIRRLAPQWFVNPADEKKKRLLALARRGAPRPTQRSLLGSVLPGYMKRDAKFNREIRRVAPQWFR